MLMQIVFYLNPSQTKHKFVYRPSYDNINESKQLWNILCYVFRWHFINSKTWRVREISALIIDNAAMLLPTYDVT